MARRSAEDTKAAILLAARERFASDGYERATIRAVATEAGIDPAMVMRYFGSKEKLFAAAAAIDLRIPEVVDEADPGPGLVRHFVERWEQDDTLRALLRAAVSHEAAAERMRALFAEQLGPVAARLAPEGAGPVRAGLVATQMVGLALSRYVLALPPVVGLSHDAIAAWLGPTISRYLTAPDPD
ncbi:AcrR family transcriptional regulator [Saccharothrix tamanrassetensis]|uniref:AcrR family transcriptional regulator n=1 Tax=Saccharothrix tamanrassetensis TaxID=1051531 RepID=A0A841CT40_9PSEU|nr:TetR family transcriptional regulator [Saccharothrix tamanrassetensis]MBB5960033.1 AcrR family transcriptional regulator [Saccharothrix tamanrassetensis]